MTRQRTKYILVFLLAAFLSTYLLLLKELHGYTKYYRKHYNPSQCEAALLQIYIHIDEYKRNHSSLSEFYGYGGIEDMSQFRVYFICNGSTRDFPADGVTERNFDYVYNNKGPSDGTVYPLVWDKHGNHKGAIGVLYSNGKTDYEDWRKGIEWMRQYDLADYYLSEEVLYGFESN